MNCSFFIFIVVKKWQKTFKSARVFTYIHMYICKYINKYSFVCRCVHRSSHLRNSHVIKALKRYVVVVAAKCFANIIVVVAYKPSKQWLAFGCLQHLMSSSLPFARHFVVGKSTKGLHKRVMRIHAYTYVCVCVHVYAKY